MRDQQRVSHIHQHVQPLPRGCGEIPQPEIVARGSHQEENNQCKESQSLKGKISDTAVPRVADEETDEWIHIPQGVELEQRKTTMCQAQKKRRDSKVPAVVEQWKKTAIQSTQWADAQHDVQQQECSGSKRADQQRLCRRARVAPGAHPNNNSEVQRQQRQKCDVVHLLLPVPADRAILDAHGNVSTLAVSNTA